MTTNSTPSSPVPTETAMAAAREEAVKYRGSPLTDAFDKAEGINPRYGRAVDFARNLEIEKGKDIAALSYALDTLRADLAAAKQTLPHESARAKSLSEHNVRLSEIAHDANTTLGQMRIGEDRWILERAQLRADLAAKDMKILELITENSGLKHQLSVAERDNAALRSMSADLLDINLICRQRDEAVQQLATLRATVAELQADKARLDWLERNARWRDNENEVRIPFPITTVMIVKLRDAIDGSIQHALAQPTEEGK